MAKVTIDGKEIEVDNGIPLIQACEIAGVEVPRFCYHDRLRIAGNCRMCLVEVEKAPKPVASCAMPVSDGMVVHTNSPVVKKAREGVLELLLINHPLDCPICDQGGECDLQDQAFKYGKGSNKFQENKRSVQDKYMGPLIQPHMTRCIHCTRCIRFMNDIAGVEELGALGRGEHMEITTYLEKAISSELSGNLIDICPVGALNSKPYAYKARKWELKHTDSIDPFDAMGTNIRIDTRGLEVMRILPRLNEDINEEWISDRIRFSYDGLKVQRLDRAYIKNNGKFTHIEFDEAISFVASKIKEINDVKRMGAIIGTMTDLETISSVKMFLEKLGSNNVDFNQFSYNFDLSNRGNYLFNSGFVGLEECDVIITVGTNIRKNAPVLGARMAKLARFSDIKIYNIGQELHQAYPVEEIGDDVALIKEIIDGKHKLAKILSAAKKVSIIIGDGVYSNEDSNSIMELLVELCKKFAIIREDWNGFNILHNHISTTGAIELGFTSEFGGASSREMVEGITDGSMDILFLFGADEVNIPQDHKGLVVYLGHHGDKSAHIADIIIPVPAFSEKSSLYINNEGKLQESYQASPVLKDAKNEFEVILMLADKLSIKMDFNDKISLRQKIQKALEQKKGNEINIKTKKKSLPQKIQVIDFNFYLSNPILRASKTMASCSKEFHKEASV